MAKCLPDCSKGLASSPIATSTATNPHFGAREGDELAALVVGQVVDGTGDNDCDSVLSRWPLGSEAMPGQGESEAWVVPPQ